MGVILDKSYNFALRIVKLYRYLNEEATIKERRLSDQVLRSGTSIGANVEEAHGAQSQKDFIAKMHISLKEARETKYWLRLLRDSAYIEEKLANSFITDADELIAILIAILKTAKEG
ncbi:MAG: four helix bundle protein [Cytophagales bacterium]|nr:MAG: four helix bundle protein [Cytophagales bacterium]